MKDERIIRLYMGSSADDEQRAKEKSLSSPISEEVKPQATEKSDKRIKTEISTENNKNARAHYNLGVAYLMLNDKNSAINEYEILKNLDIEFANKLFKENHK